MLQRQNTLTHTHGEHLPECLSWILDPWCVHECACVCHWPAHSSLVHLLTPMMLHCWVDKKNKLWTQKQAAHRCNPRLTASLGVSSSSSSSLCLLVLQLGSQLPRRPEANSPVSHPVYTETRRNTEEERGELPLPPRFRGQKNPD